MLSDLAALTPPLIVCAAFLVGVFLFLRRQMAAPRQRGDDGGEGDIGAGEISAFGDPRPDATDSDGESVSDPRHSSGR